MIYYVSTLQQYPSGIMGYDTAGQPIHANGRFSHLYEIETSDPESVVAKALEAGCHVRSCPETISVVFPIGAASGNSFAKSLGARLPARSRVNMLVRDDEVEYVFERKFALGQTGR